jgi:hypothetical protein
VGFYRILHLRLISYFHTEKDGKHYFVSYNVPNIILSQIDQIIIVLRRQGPA